MGILLLSFLLFKQLIINVFHLKHVNTIDSITLAWLDLKYMDLLFFLKKEKTLPANQIEQTRSFCYESMENKNT